MDRLQFQSFEIATCPSPAEIFLNWNGWKNKWEQGPRYLTSEEEVSLSTFKTKGLVPCKTWLSSTNDPGNALPGSLVELNQVLQGTNPLVLKVERETSSSDVKYLGPCSHLFFHPFQLRKISAGDGQVAISKL